MTDLPIVCTLSPDGLRSRRERLLAALMRRAHHAERSIEGLRLEFAASKDTLAEIVETVDAERRCCRFLRFTITVAPDEGPVTLDLTGPPGTAEFVAALLDQ